jgi:hypothetical protein
VVGPLIHRSRPLAYPEATGFIEMGKNSKMKRQHLPAMIGAAVVMAIATSPARADRCDDLAAQLANQIGGLTVGKAAANTVALSHPSVRSMHLGCRSRTVTNQIDASTEGKTPSAAFYDVIAGAAALVFTIPKKDTLNGITRCVKRIGLLRGYDIKTRYRRLNIHCTRGKAVTTVTISRNRDE